MIKKQLASLLSKRLSERSCDREEFAKAATSYNIAMKTSGYHGGFATDTRAYRRKSKRNTVRFNPPFSESVNNNIGKEFLKARR